MKKLIVPPLVFLCVMYSLSVSAFANNVTQADMQRFLSEYYYSGTRGSRLLYATEKGYRDIAIKLLESGANPNEMPYSAERWDIAERSPSEYLLPTPFIVALCNEDKVLVLEMLKHSADVNLLSYSPRRDGIPTYPILEVLRNYEKTHGQDFLKILIDNEVGLNIRWCFRLKQHDPDNGNSPLVYAIRHKLRDVVALLLKYGADANMEAPYTPLILAVEAADLEMVKLLLSYGASPTNPSHCGCSGNVLTPIGLAIKMELREIFDVLIAAEAGRFK